MKAWRVAVVALVCLVLNGCLVVFKEPIPPAESAPAQLLGNWMRQNEWGEQLLLDITRTAPNVYSAKIRVLGQAADAEVYPFTVTRSGQRWYASIGMPKRFGNHFALAGFEITKRNELVLYSLDHEPFLHELKTGGLQGEVVDTNNSDSALINSPLSTVLAYLNDPANADVFIESARYQRVEQ